MLLAASSDPSSRPLSVLPKYTNFIVSLAEMREQKVTCSRRKSGEEE
jgi:hypothetical protein